ncbi:MAG: SapC family protein [Burkholderiaceae bacterium]|nr:SapC family protein [Burkholderiaceae bacterium]
MTQLMFYERPIALNRERHQALRMSPTQNHFGFAAKTNAVPIASTEFAEAARDYPIVFVGEEGGPFNVAALVGLRDNENLMVDAQGLWATGTYVPAFARRYPFVLAKTDDADRLTVCIDEVYPGLSNDTGEPLFEADGAESAYLKRVLEFLQLFHNEAQRTTMFATRLKELGLLVSKVINVERKGTRQSLQGVWIVDRARLAGMDDVRVVELFRSGYLSWIDAHLLSLGNLTRLVSRLDEHSQVSDEAGAVVPEPAPPIMH